MGAIGTATGGVDETVEAQLELNLGTRIGMGGWGPGTGAPLMVPGMLPGMILGMVPTARSGPGGAKMEGKGTDNGARMSVAKGKRGVAGAEGAAVTEIDDGVISVSGTVADGAIVFVLLPNEVRAEMGRKCQQ